MEVKTAYNLWANQYDSNNNKTRDLEALSLRNSLSTFQFKNCLEIGCGTGKNTQWLLEKAEQITAVDLSDKMLRKAQQKINSEKVVFIEADILQEWEFTDGRYDLVIFSLVLEHIKDIVEVIGKASAVLEEKGMIYIGELHPFKQYSGTKARFETEEGVQIVNCYTHHISDFTSAANKFDLDIINIQEYFDDGDRENVPRILTLLLQKRRKI